jgi:hypothetical protein
MMPAPDAEAPFALLASMLMSIRFVCRHCRRPIEVDDALHGRHGKCKHCGHTLVVPDKHAPSEEPGLRLQPPDENEPVRGVAHLLDSPKPLSMQTPPAERERWSKNVSRPDERLTPSSPAPYQVTDLRGPRRSRRSGPTPLWLRLPSTSARLIARWLRKARDFLYLISVASLVTVALGFVFKAKTAMHLGAAVIVPVDGWMLYVGLAYLVTLPFKENMGQGLACLFVPGYIFYYWFTHWKQMRRPVLNTLFAFVPLLLLALAYFFYTEEPAIKAAIERELPQLERKVDKELTDLDSALAPRTLPNQNSSSTRRSP